MTQPTALEARSSQQLLFYFHDVWLHSAMLRTLGKKVAGWIPRIGASLCGVLPLSVRVLSGESRSNFESPKLAVTVKVSVDKCVSLGHAMLF